MAEPVAKRAKKSKNTREGGAEFVKVVAVDPNFGLMCSPCGKVCEDVFQHMRGNSAVGGCVDAKALMKVNQARELEFLVTTKMAVTGDATNEEAPRFWTRISGEGWRSMGLDPNLVLRLSPLWTPSQPMIARNWDGNVTDMGMLAHHVAAVDIPLEKKFVSKDNAVMRFATNSEARFEYLVNDFDVKTLWKVIKADIAYTKGRHTHVGNGAYNHNYTDVEKEAFREKRKYDKKHNKWGGHLALADEKDQDETDQSKDLD